MSPGLQGEKNISEAVVYWTFEIKFKVDMKFENNNKPPSPLTIYSIHVLQIFSIVLELFQNNKKAKSQRQDMIKHLERQSDLFLDV